MSTNIKQKDFKIIDIIETMIILTSINLFFNTHKNDERAKSYYEIQNAILSYIISSGNILNGSTSIPFELEVYIEELNKYSKDILKINKYI